MSYLVQRGFKNAHLKYQIHFKSMKRLLLNAKKKKKTAIDK